MKLEQRCWLAIASSLTLGLVSCSDPVAECKQLNRRASAPNAHVIAIQEFTKLEDRVAEISVEVILDGGTEAELPSFETTIQELESVSIDDTALKDLQTRYATTLREIHQAAKDWLEPSKREAARQVIAQKAPESSQFVSEISTTCTSIMIKN